MIYAFGQPRFGVCWERRGRCMVGILQAGTACVHGYCVTCFSARCAVHYLFCTRGTGRPCFSRHRDRAARRLEGFAVHGDASLLPGLQVHHGSGLSSGGTLLGPLCRSYCAPEV